MVHMNIHENAHNPVVYSKEKISIMMENVQW